jgi:hypothetical protein
MQIADEGDDVVHSTELRARLAANKARLRRQEAVERMQSFGALLASLSDRFAIHWYDDVFDSFQKWSNGHLPAHRGLDDTEHFREHGEGGALPMLDEVLANLVARHRLDGWVEILGGFDQNDLVISIEAEAIAEVVPKLRQEFPGAFDDTILVSRSRAWSLLVYHEGQVFFSKFETTEATA